MPRAASQILAALLAVTVATAENGVAHQQVFIRANTGATFPQLNHKLLLAISTNGFEWQSLHTTPTLTNFSREA